MNTNLARRIDKPLQVHFRNDAANDERPRRYESPCESALSGETKESVGETIALLSGHLRGRGFLWSGAYGLWSRHSGEKSNGEIVRSVRVGAG